MVLRSLIVSWLSLTLWGADSGEEFFEKQIRPVLSEKCISCHNAKLKAPFGGLRLDSKAAMRKGGDSGPLFIAGKPEESLLIRALSYENRKLQMPPTGRLSAEIVDKFREWIRIGAPDPRSEELPAVSVIQQQRGWAFDPPTKSKVPSVKRLDWPRTNIDHFLLAKLEAKELQPAKPVGKREWIRRLSFDLIGLPPSADQLNQYLSDASRDADQHLVDRLLASPHYGERWARHWMDLVRFSETNGHEYDNEKPDAWRYRDYLIRALNQDLPYDQLILEHVAGDLLSRPRLSQDQSFFESPIASGFLWFGEVLNSPTDSAKTRADRVDNQLDVISKSFLGVTLACARCHDHKFDPLPTKDYYAMAGMMHSTYLQEAVMDSPQRAHAIELARRSIPGTNPQVSGSRIQLRPSDLVFSSIQNIMDWQQQGQAFAAKPISEMAYSRGEGAMALVGSLTSKKFRMPRMFMHIHLAGSVPDKRVFNGGDLRVTLVADDHKAAHVYPEPNWEWKTIRMTKEFGRECYFEIVDRSRSGFIAVDQIVLSDEESPPPTTGGSIPAHFKPDAVEIPESTFALTSFDENPQNARLHIRGSHENLGTAIERGVLQAASPVKMPLITTGSGRLELAQWIASPRNPLTARVIVNRLWQHHFGQGLVRSVDNFGRMGEAPANQQLLDTLAVEFVEDGWSLKKLHRKIVLSSAYRMSLESSTQEAARKIDPRNELLWHLPPRRLDAESLRDSMLTVSESLNPELFGPSIMPHISAYQDGRGKPASGPLDGNNRRSIYIQVRRNFLTPLFLAFDYPLPISTIGQRGSSTVPAQALLMMNNAFVHQQAQRWADASAQKPDRLTSLYRSAFAREPLPEEKQAAQDYLATHSWYSLCHVLLNSAEFLYVQ